MELYVAVFNFGSHSPWLAIADTEKDAEEGLRHKWERDGISLINAMAGEKRALELFKEMTWDRAKSMYEFSILKVRAREGFSLEDVS